MLHSAPCMVMTTEMFIKNFHFLPTAANPALMKNQMPGRSCFDNDTYSHEQNVLRGGRWHTHVLFLSSGSIWPALSLLM